MARLSFHRALLILSAITLFTTHAAQADRRPSFQGCCLSAAKDLPGTPLAGNLGHSIDQGLLEDAAELSQLLGVRPGLFYMQESGGPNACAMPVTLPNLHAQEGTDPRHYPDGTVLVGLQLIKSEWRATNGSGLSIPAILAHEYAHIAQFKYRCPARGKWRELHADYLAGWFTGHRGRFRVQSAVQAMKNFFHKGDYDFNHQGHHGTPAEREAAFRAGFELNTLHDIASGPHAYKFGLDYIKSRGASL